MRIALIAAGAANMYCGSCLRDNALARAMKSRGGDVVLIPTYTPLRLDEDSASEELVFLGGVEVYLEEAFPSVSGRRGLLKRILGSQALLRWLSHLSLRTDPRILGALTVSVLEGEAGKQARLLRELVGWLGESVKPDLVHLTNALFSGLARPIKKALGVPVVCGLQGEDLFLASLPEPHQRRALGLVREHGADIDRFIAASTHAKEHMASWAGLDRGKIDVVLPGIHLEEYAALPPPAPGQRPLTIGYFARIAPEKGLHLLAAAFRELCAGGEFPDLRLKIAGYLGGGARRYAASIRRQLALWGLGGRVDLFGTVNRQEKLTFFRAIDVLSVPTAYPEPKGLFVLEALAAGVPVVEPRHGSFPELIEATGGGLLHEPGNPTDLARALAELLRDEALRRRLGESGRAAVNARFSAERMASETMAVYERLAAGGRRPAAGEGEALRVWEGEGGAIAPPPGRERHLHPGTPRRPVEPGNEPAGEERAEAGA